MVFIEFREKYTYLPHFAKLYKFAEQMFSKSKVLRHLKGRFESMWIEFRHYKESIPTYGGALLAKDFKKVLLVKGYNGGSWGFPKGKVNEGETSFECACREVYEETSFDIKKHFEVNNLVLDEENDWLEFFNKKGKKMKLLVVPEIDLHMKFKPNVRKEISEIKWFSIDSLPRQYKGSSHDTSKSKFWQVSMFSVPLRAWIKQRRREKYTVSQRTPKQAPIRIIQKPEVVPLILEPEDNSIEQILDAEAIMTALRQHLYKSEETVSA